MDEAVFASISAQHDPNRGKLHIQSYSYKALNSSYTKYTCQLCQREPLLGDVSMTSEQMNRHVQDALHQSAFRLVEQKKVEVCNKLKIAQELSLRMDAAGAPSSMKAFLGMYLFNPTLAAPEDKSILKQAEDELKKFQKENPTKPMLTAIAVVCPETKNGK